MWQKGLLLLFLNYLSKPIFSSIVSLQFSKPIAELVAVERLENPLNLSKKETKQESRRYR